MKRFTCTEEKLVVGDIVMYEGDSLTLDDADAEQYCALGWGTAEGCDTAERKPGFVRLNAISTSEGGGV